VAVAVEGAEGLRGSGHAILVGAFSEESSGFEIKPRPLMDAWATVDGKRVRAVFDTAGQVSCVSIEKAREIGLELHACGERRLEGVGGFQAASHTARVELEVGELQCVLTLAVVRLPKGVDLLLGADFLDSLSVSICYATRAVRSRGRWLRKPDMDGEPALVAPPVVERVQWLGPDERSSGRDEEAGACSSRPVVERPPSPREDSPVAEARASGEGSTAGDEVIPPRVDPPRPEAARTVEGESAGEETEKVFVTVVAKEGERLVIDFLEESQLEGESERDLEGVVVAATVAEVAVEGAHEGFVKRFVESPEFHGVFAERLLACPPKRKSVFKEEMLEGVKELPHCPPAKLSKEEGEARDAVLAEMAAAGMIKPYDGPARCRLLVVEKPSKPGERKRYRIVLDGRPVNATIRKKMAEGLDLRLLLPRLSNKKRFTKMDLTSAYYQVRAEEDLYTFQGGDGRRWSMVVQTMGAKNAMVALDNELADAFGDFLGSGELTKTADDLVLATEEDDDEAHALLVERFLKVAKEHSFVINPKKTVFCQRQVEFAGYVVGCGVVKPLRSNVQDLLSMAPPTDRHELQSVLGTFNFYCTWMVEGYGKIAAPMFKLTSTEVPFVWGEEQQQAFDTVKRKMADVSEMCIPDLSKEFLMAVDASEKGIGGVIQQWQGDRLMPVAYYSREVTPAEADWHIREKEMLAAVELLQKYSHWLRSQPVTIFTDHRSLVELGNASKISGRFRRWIHILQNFDIRWKYVKGEDNQADWLSRNPAFKTPSGEERDATFREYFKRADGAAKAGEVMKAVEEVHHLEGAGPDPEDYPLSVLATTVHDTDDEVITVMAILGDGECKEVSAVPAKEMVELVKEGYKTDAYFADIIKRVAAREPHLTYFMQGGLLFKDTLRDGAQLCVPEGPALNKILFAAHDANSHIGGHKTVAALRRFYFRDMRGVVRRYIDHCVTCLRSKAEQKRPQGLLQPMPIPLGPWRRVSIDVVGGFPPSRGKTCALVVVCYFTKMMRAMAMPENYDAELVADLIMEYVVQYTGPLESIHSDRGPVFVSELFERLWERQGTDITHTTAYHPEGDGNTEIYNKALVNGLRATLADGAGDAEWVDVLPFVVYSINSTVHAGLGISPFEADYGRKPVQAFDGLNPARLTDELIHPRAEVKKGISQEDMRRGVDRLVRQALEEAKMKQKRYADEKRREPQDYKVGDRVVVSRQALMSHEDREMETVLGRKLGPLFIGPYKIVEKGRNAYRLQLPSSMRAHDMINVKYLRPFKADGSFGRPDEPPPIFVEGEVYFRPEAIKKHAVEKSRNGKQRHLYLVKFVGYTDSHNKWLSVDELQLCRDMVKNFWEASGVDPPKGALPKA